MGDSATAPYLGANISLISKSEIRYEGILYSIDTKESKIALQNGVGLVSVATLSHSVRAWG